MMKKLTRRIVFELNDRQLEIITAGKKEEKTRVCPNCGRILPAYQISCCCGW